MKIIIIILQAILNLVPMRNGFDVINATANKNAFDLYKYSRDSKDELAGQIGELKTELAVLKATRPY